MKSRCLFHLPICRPSLSPSLSISEWVGGEGQGGGRSGLEQMTTLNITIILFVRLKCRFSIYGTNHGAADRELQGLCRGRCHAACEKHTRRCVFPHTRPRRCNDALSSQRAISKVLNVVRHNLPIHGNSLDIFDEIFLLISLRRFFFLFSFFLPLDCFTQIALKNFTIENEKRK